MDIDQARALAQELMAFHGLTGWSFAFDRAKRRAGAAHFDRKQITLSRALTEASDDDAVRDTILHEIAHVLVGPGHGHDRLWQETCVRIGGSGQVRLRNAPHIPGAWVGVCPAGHRVERFRRPSRPLSCAICHPRAFSADHEFVWRRREQ
ncbi:SprT-like domain-containing protein [Arcanobacterium phocisimile]|uniref:SprT-like domain-containing protein n=1 Tax=Arcanobacterium phocisimile TaxID=1302235 RepID=A0ABX7IH48_9ACTO|nr:SprT-like domain-containing protein [Arcanobacterium phocisimile]QRV02282.1 SprT-like domain-containing protein [Arcanobacterium phocisimile]